MTKSPIFKRAVTQILVLVPLLWSGAAWHDAYHLSHLNHSGAVHPHGNMSAHGDVVEADSQTSAPSDDASALIEAASHCESGSCTGAINTRTELAEFEGSNREIARIARRAEYTHPPLTPPPIFTS